MKYEHEQAHTEGRWFGNEWCSFSLFRGHTLLATFYNKRKLLPKYLPLSKNTSGPEMASEGTRCQCLSTSMLCCWYLTNPPTNRFADRSLLTLIFGDFKVQQVRGKKLRNSAHDWKRERAKNQAVTFQRWEVVKVSHKITQTGESKLKVDVRRERFLSQSISVRSPMGIWICFKCITFNLDYYKIIINNLEQT